ncbi:hypothetical protein [Chitinophaga sp.]|uniref:hypothetical protein n=1 Tax=Chitinophaga sp. TaxID=1869181 RepID=UPI0031DD5A34
MKEKALAFSSGIIASIPSWPWNDGVKTLLLAMLGGIGGMIGKEIFNHIKFKIKRWRTLK